MAFTGRIAQLPLGVDGLTGTKNMTQVRPSQLLVADSITFEDGTLRKIGGASKYNSTALTGAPSVIAGHDWFPTAGTQRMVIVTSDGKIYKDSGGKDFATTLKTGLTVSSVVPIFVEGGAEVAANNRKLFIFTEKNVVQVLSADGATTSDITTPPADWSGANQPIFGLNHEDRIWGGGNANDPHRLYYSIVADHEDFAGSGSGTIAIFPGEGERLIGAISFKGLIVCWKFPVGVYYVDTTDPTIANWKVRRLNRRIGGVSPRGAIAIDNDLLFIDIGGNLHLISTVTEFGNLGSINLSQRGDMGPFVRENVALDQLEKCQAVYYVAKRQVMFAVAGAGSTTNTRMLVVDFNRLDLPRFHFDTRDTTESLWLRQDGDNVERPVSGDDAGFVRTMDEETASKDGAGYVGQFQSPHLDFSDLDPVLGTVRKKGHFLELVVEPKGNWNLNVTTVWDGEDAETITFNMGSTGADLGSFVLGTDKLGGDQILNKKRRITGSGRRFSIIGKNNGAAQDFSVSRFYLHFTPMDERL